MEHELTEAGIDCSECVDLSDLTALWSHFTQLQAKTLLELQNLCEAVGGDAYRTTSECVLFLMFGSEPSLQPAEDTTAEPPCANSCPTKELESSPDLKPRALYQCLLDERSPSKQGGKAAAALEVARRINDFEEDDFASNVDWGFAVLELPTTGQDIVSVHKAYRCLMRVMHPDRAGSPPEVVGAIELVRKAKDICDRFFRQRTPPARPTMLSCTHLCRDVGSRKFRVQWKPPESHFSAPVHRYIVAVFDPSYGKPLVVGTLEPDYSQEQKRYLAYNDPELCNYVISEQELRKMPSLFQKDIITVHVAAGNNEGQSEWSILKVKNGLRKPASAIHSSGRPSTSAHPAASKNSLGTSNSFKAVCTGSFERNVNGKSGHDLEEWLRGQLKCDMKVWLERRSQQTTGSKENLLHRIITHREELAHGFQASP
jgi:hypothetical protein